MEERDYWLGFSVFPGVGPKRFQALLTYFSTVKDAWNASESELKESGLGEQLSEKFIAFRSNFSLESYLKKLEQKSISYLTFLDKEYPMLLQESHNPPFVLFMKGEFDFNDSQNQMTVGIVGTRRITSYGRQVTEMITESLVDAGCVIVSGLAMGVDAVTHQTTLNCNGKTIAVLGCGVDCCNPSTNQRLYDEIIVKGGAVISEFPLEQAPTKGSFPSRNRIIAGLSKAIIVTEGAEDSGALITAQDAFTNNRKVFAVPGPITSSLSKGPNSLFSKGAQVVTSGQDVLRELGINSRITNKKRKDTVKGDTAEEQKILDLLQNETMHFDELVRKSELSPAIIGTLLSLMEMKGLVRNTESSTYILCD